MIFFFVRDEIRRYRFFSSEPVHPPQFRYSKTRQFWEKAKVKLFLLPARIFRQEQALDRAGKWKDGALRILHSGRLEDNKIRQKFHSFLRRQWTSHVLILAGEALLLPVSAVAAVLPGPNFFFYVLAVLMIVQFQAVQGIRRLLRAEPEFEADPGLADWENAVEAGREGDYNRILDDLEKRHGLRDARKVLRKGRPGMKTARN